MHRSLDSYAFGAETEPFSFNFRSEDGFENRR